MPLVFLASAFIGSKYLYTLAARKTRPLSDTHSLFLVPFLVGFSTIMLFALHGTSALKVYFIISCNYAIAKAAGASKAGPLLTWAFNMLVLFGNEWNSGWHFASIHPTLASMVRSRMSVMRLADLTQVGYERRTRGRGSIPAGISASISPCSDSCPSAWTITGHATALGFLM